MLDLTFAEFDCRGIFILYLHGLQNTELIFSCCRSLYIQFSPVQICSSAKNHGEEYMLDKEKFMKF